MYDEAYNICPIALKDVRVSILTDKANACFNKNFTTDYSMQFAIDACNKALEIIPSSTEVLKVRAEAYRKLGKTKLASDDEAAINENITIHENPVLSSVVAKEPFDLTENKGISRNDSLTPNITTSVRLEPGLGIGNQNQGPISVSVSEPEIYI